jgi:transposase-like protein
MRKGYYKSDEISIIENLENLRKNPKSDILQNFDHERLRHLVQDALHGSCMEIGIAILALFIENEVDTLCGNKYEHQDKRKCYRYGKQDGYAYVGGQRVPIRKPRVRTLEGQEKILQTYQVLQDPARLHESALRHMMLGVSTRKYDRVLEHASERLSVKKSSISKAFKMLSRNKLKEFSDRRLESYDIPVIFLDGINFGGDMMIGAVGIEIKGKKLVLGIRQGNTENSRVVEDLLADIKDRGLQYKEGILFVIDGSKALAKSIQTVFGDQAYIQRCRVHKKRNVLEYLSEDNKTSIGIAIDDAYSLTDHAKAIHRLELIAKQLDKINPDAASSMREGLLETCTVLKFNVDALLVKTLLTTNPIESAFSIVETMVKRVKRWKGDDMRKRWLVTGLAEAEQRMNRVRGSKYLPDLRAAMKTDQEKRFGILDESKEVG